MGAPGEEFGPYLVYEQLGFGGMATVHRAETTGIAGFRRPVALKRMLPGVAANADLVKSFIREARLASHLRHENVAQTYDLGKVGETYFIAMELVPGRNLREILQRSAMVVGPMPIPLVLNILNQVCDALDYAHNLCDETGQPLGIIHRDVSPANVIVSESGTVKLIDFGIAKASAQGLQTMSRSIKGKFAYMAPEYLEGRIDARVDLFALGVIAHELLSNRPLFDGRDDMDTLLKVRQMPILPPSHFRREVPSEIDAIVMTALARDPDQRWQRATALRTALTEETRRLGMLVPSSQVVEWVTRAFDPAAEAVPDRPFDPAHNDSAPVIEISDPAIEPPPPVAPPPTTSAPTLLMRPTTPRPVARTSTPPLSVLPPLPGAPPPPKPEPSESARTGLFEGRRAAVVETTTTGDATTNVAHGAARRHGVVYPLLILAIAGATAALVYFGLLYFT